MQSGRARTRDWVVRFEPKAARRIDPLMGWTSSSDTDQQVTMRFPTREAAVAYCERRGISYQVLEPPPAQVQNEVLCGQLPLRRGEVGGSRVGA